MCTRFARACGVDDARDIEQDASMSEASGEASGACADGLHKVEALVQRRKSRRVGGGFEILVKWAGTDESTGKAWEMSWEPLEEVADLGLPMIQSESSESSCFC